MMCGLLLELVMSATSLVSGTLEVLRTGRH